MVHVRTAHAADLSHVRSCLAFAFEPYRAEYAPAMFENTVPTLDGLENRAADMTIWVACALDGEVVGTIAAAVIGGNVGHLRGMAVKPAHRRPVALAPTNDHGGIGPEPRRVST